MEDKKKKKVIVNSITSCRILATILTPILFNVLSAPLFIVFIGAILLTDSLDGILARKWKVSTLGGSILDMSADKVFAFSVLIALATMFPVMLIPLGLETLISSINLSGINKSTIGKSSQLGRIKTWIMGLSIFSLLLVGLTPELIESLKNIKIDEFVLNKGNIIASNLENIKMNFQKIGTDILEFINAHKKSIEHICETATITSESLVATDYAIKATKKVDPNSKTIKIAELLKNKEFLKEVLFNEKYYSKVNNVKDMSILEKLTPNAHYEEMKQEESKSKAKELTLN